MAPLETAKRRSFEKQGPPPLPPLPTCLGGERQRLTRSGLGESWLNAEQRRPVTSTGLGVPRSREALLPCVTRPSTAPGHHPRPRTPMAPVCCTAVVVPPGQVSMVGNASASIFVAARIRKELRRGAVKSDPAGCPWVERSELCEEARNAVRSWGRGSCSARQCLLRLERCAGVARLVDDVQQLPAERARAEEEVQRSEAALWVAGCPTLGATGPAFSIFAAEMGHKTPEQSALEGCYAVEDECGVSFDRLRPDEINLALRRISQRARGKGVQPVARFLRVQVWRELLRLQTDVERPSDEESCDAHDETSGDIDDVGVTASEQFGLATPAILGSKIQAMELDAEMSRRLQLSDQEFKKEAQALPLAALKRSLVKAEEYAVQLLRYEQRLRAALETWSKFDPYRILGLSRTATMAQIRRAFFKLALVAHPDKGGQKEQFQELQRAYDQVLSERGSKSGSQAETNDQSDDEEEDWEAERERRRRERQQKNEEARREKEEAKKKEDARKKEEEEEERRRKEKDKAEAKPSEDDDKKARKESKDSVAADSLSESSEDDITKDDIAEEAGRAERRKQRAQLKRLVEDVQKASERAGSQATRALRHVHAISDALDDDGLVDMSQAWRDAAMAIEAAVRVASVAKTTGQLTGEVAGILEQLAEEHLVRDEPETLDCVTMPTARSELEEAAASASRAVAAVNEAASACSAAVEEASSRLRRARCLQLAKDGPPPDLRQLVQAMRPLGEAVREAAVSAFEAADACADAVGQARAAKKTLLLEEESRRELRAKGNEASADTAEVEKVAQPNNADEDEQKEAAEKRKAEVKAVALALETRRAVSSLSDVNRTIRRADEELRALLKQARALVKRDASAIPALPEDQREHLLSLTAEFLDAAAVSFHDALQRCATGSAYPDGPDFARGGTPNVVLTTLADCFGFLRFAAHNSGLALPVDVRAQVIRASSVIDKEAMREMLHDQLPRRLESSITFIRCSCRKPTMSADDLDDVAAMRQHLAAVVQSVLEAPDD